MSKFVYLDDKRKFLEYSYSALKTQFHNKKEFLTFFDSICSNEAKNHFLYISSIYLFLVKACTFEVNVSGSDKEVDYITNTPKFVNIFSLVEALYTKDEYVDFFTFLTRRKSNVGFPIKNRSELEEIYKRYKQEYGATQKAVRFFNSLSPECKELIRAKLKIVDSENSISDLAKLLYEIRSKFLHQGRLVKTFGPGTTIGKPGKKVIVNDLTIEDVESCFEYGLLAYFGWTDTMGKDALRND